MPLRITAELGEPLVYFDDGLHLDGLLGHAAMLAYREERGRGVAHCKPGWLGDLELPLARWEVPAPRPQRYHSWMLTRDHEHVWGWCASAVEADWRATGKMEIRKKPEVTQMGRWTTAASHVLSSGPLKAYDMALPALLATELRWFARGDPAAVSALLQRVTHVGKKHRLGMGRVLRWDVQTIGHDWSIARDGRLMRRMPDPAASSPLVAAVRAPYSDPNRQMPALEVGAAWA